MEAVHDIFVTSKNYTLVQNVHINSIMIRPILFDYLAFKFIIDILSAWGCAEIFPKTDFLAFSRPLHPCQFSFFGRVFFAIFSPKSIDFL